MEELLELLDSIHIPTGILHDGKYCSHLSEIESHLSEIECQ